MFGNGFKICLEKGFKQVTIFRGEAGESQLQNPTARSAPGLKSDENRKRLKSCNQMLKREREKKSREENERNIGEKR